MRKSMVLPLVLIFLPAGFLFGCPAKEKEPVVKKELTAAEREKQVFAALDKGALALRAGKADLARAHFEDAQKLAPDDGRVFFWLGQAAAEKGEDPKARTLLEKAVARAPDNFEWIQSLDVLLVRMGDLPAVINLWDAYLLRNPEKAEAFLARANAHLRNKNAEGNKADLQKACDLKMHKACRLLQVVR
jgi:tetratricopeptide (TPR) repeat protein